MRPLLCFLVGVELLFSQSDLILEHTISRDLPKVPGTRIASADASNGRLAVSIPLADRTASILVFDSTLNQTHHWRLPRQPSRLSLGLTLLATLAATRQGTLACAFPIETGPADEKCVLLPDSSGELASRGDVFYTMIQARVHEVSFAGTAYSPADPNAFHSEHPFTFTRFGPGLLLLDLATLQGRVLLEPNQPSRSLEFSSPKLNLARLDRAPQELLASHVVPYTGSTRASEVWIARARWKVNEGLPLDRFDTTTGAYSGTVLLRIPAFPDLVRPVHPLHSSGNPTGHLVGNRLLFLGRRILVIDDQAGRLVGFELPSTLLP